MLLRLDATLRRRKPSRRSRRPRKVAMQAVSTRLDSSPRILEVVRNGIRATTISAVVVLTGRTLFKHPHLPSLQEVSNFLLK